MTSKTPTDRDYDPCFNPKANVAAGQALDVDDEWVPDEDILAALEMAEEYASAQCRLAKVMAEERAETAKWAWACYLGHATQLVAETVIMLKKRHGKKPTMAKVCKELGISKKRSKS